MRIRKRYAVMLAVAAIIVGVVSFQALTRHEEPYVRLVGVVPSPPVARMECRDGEAWILYTTGDGRQLEPTPTGDACSERGWDRDGPVNRPDRQ